MVGFHRLDVFRADDGVGARILDDAVAIDDDDVRIDLVALSARKGRPRQ